MVAPRRAPADARLLPRRGRTRPPLLALPRRPLRPRSRRLALIRPWAVRMSAYAEIAVTTNFSFLRGASHPGEFVEQAAQLGLSAIGIADRNSLAGVVRAWSSQDEVAAQTDKPLAKLLIG